MSNIYKYKNLEKPSFFQKLLKSRIPSNFVIEVNNLLSQKDILSISLFEISTIAQNYSGNIVKKSNQSLASLYEEYLNFCLADNVLSGNEINELKHLKEILSLSDNEIKALHNKITTKIYTENVTTVIKDGKLDKSEELFLSQLQKDLMLSDELANKISGEVRGQFVSNIFDNIIADGRLSPDEEHQLDQLSANLNIKFQIDDKTKMQLDKLKLFWVIENGEIPTIQSQLSLEKNEVCYFQTDCEWYEMKTVTQRINYSGTTASIRIMKGVRYRVGTIKPQRITSEQLTRIDSGTMYLTNKRLILVGQLKNSNIKLNKVLSFTPYTDYVEISKDTGRNPLLKFNYNIDVFSAILSRLLND
jgi:hypothetical protein